MPQVYEITFGAGGGNVIDPRDVNRRGYLFLPARSDEPDSCHVIRWDDDSNPTASVPSDPDRYASAVSPGSHASLHADTGMPSYNYANRDYYGYLARTFGVWCSMLYDARVNYDSPWVPEFKNLSDFLSFISPGQVEISPGSDSGGSLHSANCEILMGGWKTVVTLWCVDVDPSVPSSTAPTPTSSGALYVGYLQDSSDYDLIAAIESALLGMFPNLATSLGGSSLTIGNPARWSSVTGFADFAGSGSATTPETYVTSGSSPSFTVNNLTAAGWASSGFVGDSAKLVLTADDATVYSDVMSSEYLDSGFTITLVDDGTPIALPLSKVTGYWHSQAGDPGDGSLPDYAPPHRDGTLIGGSYASDGTYGTVLEFDGSTSQWGSLPDLCFSEGPGAKTLLALFSPDTTTGDWQWAAAFGHAPAFFLGVNGSTVWGGGFGDGVNSGAGAFTAGQWIAAALTYDGTTAKLYVNGVLKDSQAKTWSHIHEYGRIGRQIGGLDENLDGRVAQVVAFDDVALSAEEVAAWAADPFGSIPVGDEAALEGVCETETECEGGLTLAAALEGVCETETECTVELGLTVTFAGLVETETEGLGSLSLSVALAGECETESEGAGALSLGIGLEGVCETETECASGLMLGLPVAGVIETETECTGDVSTLTLTAGPYCGCVGMVSMVTGDGGDSPDVEDGLPADRVGMVGTMVDAGSVDVWFDGEGGMIGCCDGVE